MTTQYELPPLEYSSLKEWLRKIALALRGVMLGQTNNTREVTLRANETETIVQDLRIRRQGVFVLAPRTDTAAAALATTWAEWSSTNELTIHHASDPGTDRTFGLVFHG